MAPAASPLRMMPPDLKLEKKRRADLQADEENEKYQTEVAQEG